MADFTPDEAASMDVNNVLQHLDSYEWSSNILGLKAVGFGADCLKLYCAHCSLPSDSLTERVLDGVVDSFKGVRRKGKEQDLRKFRQRIEGLYQEYRPVFVRANRLLAQKGVEGVSLREFTLAGQDFSLNNFGNMNWTDELSELIMVLQDFITRTNKAAETLAARLKESALAA